MLQKQSIIKRGDNSTWLILKIFTIYRNGHKKSGNVSYMFVAAIKKRRFINPNKRRNQIAHKAFGCIITTRNISRWIDGQLTQIKINKGAAFSRRIRRSRLKIKSLVFYQTKRTKYIKLARTVL